MNGFDTPITFEQVKSGYDRVDRLRESANAAARNCAQSLLDDDPVTAQRFAERYRNHLASGDRLRDELMAALAAKYGSKL
jgi:predicted nucleic acid-binding protein